jgi:hypothetical protein
MVVLWGTEHGFARRSLLVENTSQGVRLLGRPFAVHCAFERDSTYMHLRLHLVSIGTKCFYVLAHWAEQ